MELKAGEILEGRVTGITKFGAFVALPGGKSGLVHISELSNSYVNEVSEHVQLGQTIKVKLLSISPDGKISLSAKKAVAAPPRKSPAAVHPLGETQAAAMPQELYGSSADQSFEDRLKKFMKESDSRVADNPIYAENRRRSRRR